MIGIYKLNFKDGTFYIGQSVNIDKRLYYHSITKGRGSPKLIKAYTESEYIGYEILEECSGDIISAREVYWIEKLKPVLNTLPGGTVLSGFNHPRAKYTKEQVLRVVQLYVDTEMQLSDIARTMDMSVPIVHDICKGRAHTWATVDIDLETVRATRENAKSFYIYDPYGNKHLVEERSQFETLHGLSPGSITRILTNASNSLKSGWSLFPIDNTQYLLTTDEGLEFKGNLVYIKELFYILDIPRATRQKLLKGRTSLGYTLKNLEETGTKNCT